MISAWSVFAAFLGSIVGALAVFALLVLCYATMRVLLERYLTPRRHFPFRQGAFLRRPTFARAQYPVSAHWRG
jgi:hypothetical protein